MNRFHQTDCEEMRENENFSEPSFLEFAPPSVRLSTHLVGHYVHYRSVKFRGSNFPRGREKLGVSEISGPNNSPLRVTPPNFENST
jgi:hypothetical protein